MPTYQSLVPGGHFARPDDKSLPVSDRTNNPGAVNGAAWLKSEPGFVTNIKYDGKNDTTVFEAPEYGVAVWYKLMVKYRASGAKTVHDIIWKYGGGQANYTAYATQVAKWTGLAETEEILLTGDDARLLLFAKAMFRYEIGNKWPGWRAGAAEPQIPWSDVQLRHGLALARGTVKPSRAPTPPAVAPPTAAAQVWGGFLAFLGFGRRVPPPVPRTPLTAARELKLGDEGPDVAALQARLREVGFTDVIVDGEFGEVTQQAVRSFQTRRNIDPDGEVGEITRAELNRDDAPASKPPLLPPSTAKYGEPPPWYKLAEGDIGFHEVGVNRGIEKFIAQAHTGSLGDPWCAIGVNAKLEQAGIHGSRSAMARSFETSKLFRRLSGPALGAIVTMWRTSPSSGLGHVFFYDGEGPGGVRGIGYNEDDQVKRSFHPPGRVVGYYWPTDLKAPAPRLGRITVGGSGAASSEV